MLVRRIKVLHLYTKFEGHCSVKAFLTGNFQLVTPFCSILDIGSGTGQIDRETTAINALCPTLQGLGHNNFVTEYAVVQDI